MQTSQLAGLTTGTFSELFLQLPPGGNSYENVAEVLTTLTADNEASGAVQNNLQDQIDGKQNLLTARFPIRLQNDVLSFGFLIESDAINAAQERIAHLMATNQNTADIAALQTTVAAQTATINAQGAVIVEHQNLLDQLVTLLPPPPGNDYIQLNGTTNHIAFPSGFSDILD